MSETTNDSTEPNRETTESEAHGGDVDVSGADRTPGEGLVQVENLTKVYDPDGANVTAVQDMDLHIGDNEFVTVLGPSGCGKSTLLECIAGYLEPTSGSVVVDGADVSEPDPSRGVVFQENRLFPWKTIGENVRFGPTVRDDSEVDQDRVEELLDKTGLEQFEDAYPNELSGGMQQRAELSRLLANDPEIMLMDEPFSGLDAMTKELMQEMLLEIWDDENRTVMFITHDVEEAIFLADRVVVMTARPGQVKGVIDVELDRPRDFEVLTTDRFTRYKDRALELIHEEAERAMEQADQGK
ncbi:NitT/TauT family transport system ATP-binding protein [Halogeometricum rufum]|jgi:NitT/TauT family transport system ATP-binding protein|uniref:NitT/TauT family transport system ATP-binding protein n=1 Tax=Halogeometricum rufum TaxID=553469 RepID=A0A1I6GXP2_9EURY|nr:ABC transporter ATP-binding protein [Halogeometricum rufum]SFR46849.1 NitT/TauT family transport system ATP-binding protein [Halogeometricum rufum]